MVSKRKIISIFVVCVMVFMSFTACSQKAKDSASTATSTTNESVTSEGQTDSSTTSGGNNSTTTSKTGSGDVGNEGVSGARTLEGNAYTSGFPIVQNQIELRVMAEKTSLHGDFDAMAFTKEYLKKTNIKIKWELYSTADRVNKKALALMSGNPPDVMCMIDAFTSSDIITYGEQQMIVPIDPLLQKWAPNVKKALDVNAVAKKSVTAPDGHIYSVPLIHSVADHTLFPEKMYINKKWLDALKLSVPTTYTELLNVLRQFKKGDPNANGQADEIPIAVSAFSPMLSGAPQGVSWDWTTDRMYVDKTDKIGYFMASDAFRDSIKFYKTLYSESLMDKNIFDGKATITGKTLSGNVGVFTALAGALSLKEADLKNYVMLPAIKSTASSTQTVMARQRNKVTPFSFVITATALKDKSQSKVEAALRWVDYFYTTEGYILEQYGPTTGGYYKKLSTGKLQLLPNKTDSDRYKIAPGYVLPSWFTIAAKDVWAVKPQSQWTEADKFFNNIDDAQSAKLYKPLVQQMFIPNMFFSKADNVQINSISDPIHSYAFNSGVAFVKGTNNIDTGWNDYITELKRLGVDKFVSIYQKAYNSAK